MNFEPNIVVIMLGTNDSKPYNWVHDGDFYADYISMIDTFENLSTHLEVIVVYPPKAFKHNYDIDDSVVCKEFRQNFSFLLNHLLPTLEVVKLPSVY